MRYGWIILLCLIFSGKANAFCRTITPMITVFTRAGVVRYITHLSRDEFLRNAPQKMSPNTLGMTVSKLGITGSADPEVQHIEGHTFCVQIKRFDLTIGYNTLDVYIDRKYAPGSCEYEVVKEHENYHVRVSQEAMMFFKSDIEQALETALSHIEPEYAYSGAEAQQIFQRQFNRVIKEIQPLIDYINAKIAEKNYIIDTPESYAQTSALCDNW
ncbi:MAG: hypothetical protein SPL08_02365 [Pseudomonadota bacterium]|nr:hypothetical protein [Pseudomonadota bacterium]